MMLAVGRVRHLAGSGMARYLAGRLVAALVTLFVVTVVVFAALHLLPGSYADVVLPPDASPELRAVLNAQFGLDRPLPEQYVDWLGSLLSGNFGVSRGNRSTVALLLARRI